MRCRNWHATTCKPFFNLCVGHGNTQRIVVLLRNQQHVTGCWQGGRRLTAGVAIVYCRQPYLWQDHPGDARADDWQRAPSVSISG